MGGGRERESGEREGREWKIAFWNVTVLKNKDKNFWEGIKDVLGCFNTVGDVGGQQELGKN